MSQPAIAFLNYLGATYPLVPVGDIGLPEDFVQEDDEALDIKVTGGRVYVVARRGVGTSEVDFAWMQAEPPRVGLGTLVLRDLCLLADKHRVSIKLIPKGQDPGLIQFYASHGFVQSKAPDFLIREPR